MCYNDKCRIKIKSVIDGEGSSVTAKGQLKKTPTAACFSYKLDGDDCTLTVTENEAVQTRRGGQNTEIRFRRGEYTACLINYGGLGGKTDVFTEELVFREGKTCTLYIGYTLGGQKIELTFSAKRSIGDK